MGRSTLSSALSHALCYINRIVAASPDTACRVVAITVSPDTSSQYISIMNNIFSACKLQVAIDGCVLGACHSSFLQQAAELTGVCPCVRVHACVRLHDFLLSLPATCCGLCVSSPSMSPCARAHLFVAWRSPARRCCCSSDPPKRTTTCSRKAQNLTKPLWPSAQVLVQLCRPSLDPNVHSDRHQSGK